VTNLCELKLWGTVGSTADEPDVSGTITIPEIAHDTEEDEFVVGLTKGNVCVMERVAKFYRV
jgi:hypothetical protein